MTHESLVSPRSVAFKDNETTSGASISFFIYKVSRLRPLGMVGFEPTTQIPLTHPYDGNHHRSLFLPFRAGEDEGIGTLDSQIKSLLLYQLSYISILVRRIGFQPISLVAIKCIFYAIFS